MVLNIFHLYTDLLDSELVESKYFGKRKKSGDYKQLFSFEVLRNLFCSSHNTLLQIYVGKIRLDSASRILFFK